MQCKRDKKNEKYTIHFYNDSFEKTDYVKFLINTLNFTKNNNDTNNK